MTLGEKIQKLRKDAGISQEQLAEQLGVSRQSISKWELNDVIPEIGKIIVLSELFNISTDELLKNSKPQNLKNKTRHKFIQSKRIFISLGIGFILAMIVMSIKIYFGYAYAYKSGADGYMVKVFGIGIYALIRHGDIYLGTAMGKGIGLLCTIFMVCSMMVEQVVTKIRNK